jgi:hypothetical protein
MNAPVKWFAVAGSIVAVCSIILWLVINDYYSRVESEVAKGSKKKGKKLGDTEKGGFLEYDTVRVQMRRSA